MKSALVKEKLENHGSQKYSSKRVKMINPKPTDTPIKVPTAIQTSGNNPNDTPITVPTTIQTSVIKKGIKPDDPPQNVATSHLEDPISTTTNLDEAYPLDTSCELLPILESPSLSSELQDYSSVNSVEIEFLPEPEGQLDHTNLSPTDVSLNTMTMNCSDYKMRLMHQMTILTIMTFIPVRFKMISSSMPPTLATPLHFMAQHNCGDQEPTDDPSAVSTTSQASCDHTIKPKCAHNPMDFPVQWSKFIHTSPRPRMTKTPFQIAVHVAYSPIASMNYMWTINLHDGYPLFQVMKPEGYILPSLHILTHDLSSLAPPKGEMKSSFSWISLFKSPTSSS